MEQIEGEEVEGVMNNLGKDKREEKENEEIIKELSEKGLEKEEYKLYEYEGVKQIVKEENEDGRNDKMEVDKEMKEKGKLKKVIGDI